MIVTSTADGVTTLTIDDPRTRNALTAGDMHDLVVAVEASRSNDDVKVVVLRGAGGQFCSGFNVSDPSEFEGVVGESRRARFASIAEKAAWMRALLASPKPLVAAVHGVCIGIGTYLTLVADFAVARDDAAFGLPEERFGSAGATWVYPFLIREVGLKRANELVMTGRRFGAEEFAALGLVNRMVEHDRFDASVADLGAALCSLPREGIALNRVVKQMALSVIGHATSFDFHAALHPHAEHLGREADEFDFMGRVQVVGMKAALAERNERFGGDWWGW